jgi:hypothetical protein
MPGTPSAVATTSAAMIVVLGVDISAIPAQAVCGLTEATA